VSSDQKFESFNLPIEPNNHIHPSKHSLVCESHSVEGCFAGQLEQLEQLVDLARQGVAKEIPVHAVPMREINSSFESLKAGTLNSRIVFSLECDEDSQRLECNETCKKRKNFDFDQEPPSKRVKDNNQSINSEDAQFYSVAKIFLLQIQSRPNFLLKNWTNRGKISGILR
jgi:hypothetical protein